MALYDRPRARVADGLEEAMTEMRRLVVAVHDVSPETLVETRFLLSALDRMGIKPRVLKVIPQHLLDCAPLVELLRTEQEMGSEIVQHGFSHRRVGPFRGPLQRQLRAALFAPDVAEFLSISFAETASRLADGHEILRRAGLRATGFCAPGWLAATDLHPILRRAGFLYDVLLSGVVDLANRRRIWTGWIGYMGAGSMQERFVGIADAINRATAPLFGAVKVFLHPQGAPESPACRRILEGLPGLTRGRTLVTYRQLVAGSG